MTQQDLDDIEIRMRIIVALVYVGMVWCAWILVLWAHADRKPLTNWQWELMRKKCDYKKLRREYLDFLSKRTT